MCKLKLIFLESLAQELRK